MRQRHPPGLYFLFLTEMWERFGFYCMEAVFVLYMKNSNIEFLCNNYSRIYGLYLAGVYFTPFVGGLLADWWLGYPLAIALGAISFGAGYWLLSWEPAVCFAAGLACIIIGNGLFKPNISTMVGKLYPRGDPRIDSAFTIFYMGINVGALAAPITAAIIETLYGKPIGYRYAFAVAGCGMVLSLAIFLASRRWIVAAASEDTEDAAGETEAVPAATPGMSRRKLALIVFFVINIVFWMAFKQKGNTLSTWAQDRTELQPPVWLASGLAATRLDGVLLNKEGQMAAPLFAAINPLFVILFSPLLVWVWNTLRALRLDVPTPAKLVLGFALTAGAFAIMWQVAAGTSPTERVTPLALVACYAVLTLGELCLSPIGLSLVTKLAPEKTRAVWMGMFFVSISVGGLLAGEVRQYVADWPYAVFFMLLTVASAFAMILMLAAYPVIATALRPAPANSNE